MRILRATILLCATAACCASIYGGAAAAERAVLVTLEGGSRVLGLCEIPAVWKILKPESTPDVQTSDVLRASIGPRSDPNIENEALVAVGDLQSADFSTRDKALAKLRSLGQAAAKPLRQALASTEAETARHARTLIAELGISAEDNQTPDRIEFKNGKTLNCQADVSDMIVRTRWGKLEIPVESIKGIEFVQDTDASTKLEKELAASSRVSNEIVVAASSLKAVNESATPWDPIAAFEKDPIEMTTFLGESGERMLNMDKVPEPKKAGDTVTKWIDSNGGDRIEDAYLEKGVRIRATEKNAAVEISNEGLRSLSSGRSAASKNSDVEFTFLRPNAVNPAETPGVFFAGAVVRTEGLETVGIAAYDAAGRLLGQAFNNRPADVNANGKFNQFGEFLGLRSTLPIARVKFFRAGAAKANNSDVVFDDFVFDRPVPGDLRAGNCRIETTRNELLTGTPLKSEAGRVALKLAWLGAKADPAVLAFDEIKRYEVAHTPKSAEAESTEEAQKAKQPRRPRAITPHDILLQSGEKFRARLISMNDKEAVFLLAKGVEITLPKSSLKRIDLFRPDPANAPKPPENLTTPALPVEEKPGVLLKVVAGRGQPGAPLLPKEEIADPTRNPAQGIDRIDDAEIFGVDPRTWMLILKDENGNESEIGMPGVQALIFPREKNAVPANQKRGWKLTLREGSSFEVDLKNITPDAIHTEMAGGVVVLPTSVVESIERVK